MPPREWAGGEEGVPVIPTSPRNFEGKTMRKSLMAALLRPLILSAALLVSACVQGSTKQRITYASALIGETTARTRCPRNALELGVMLGIRIAVDSALQNTLTDEEFAALKAARALTDQICGIVIVPLAAPPEVAPPPRTPATPQV